MTTTFQSKKISPHFITVLLWLSFILASPNVSIAADDHPGEATGYQDSGYDLSQYENINLANGNLTFQVPLYTLQTDGGLTYNLSLYHNLKRWRYQPWCVDGSSPPNGSCYDPEDVWHSAEIADGIENYGFTWDLRPPRLSEVFGTPLAFVDQAGGRHFLFKNPPWQEENQEPCLHLTPEQHTCYTCDGTQLRVTATDFEDNDPVRVEVEDSTGTLYILEQVVQVEYPLGPGYAGMNFRQDVDGLYTTAIEQGPWNQTGAGNRIEFEYCSDDSSSDCYCAAPWGQPYLVRKITALGEHNRSVNINYREMTLTIPEQVTIGVLDSVDIPHYDRNLGTQGSNLSEPINFEHELYEFSQTYLPGGLGVFHAPRLHKVIYPNLAQFEFTWIGQYGSASYTFNKVVIPSGAEIKYTIFPDIYPLGVMNCSKYNGSGSGASNCMEVIGCNSYGLLDSPSSSSSGTEGIMQRIINYNDASGPRTETTNFYPYKSCAAADPEEPDPWPYNFEYALFTETYNNLGYLWTWVETYANENHKEVEIHRFHPTTYEEFSVDYLSNTDFVPPGQPISKEDFGAWTDVRRLKHTEMERAEKFDLPWIPAGNELSRDMVHYTYLKESRTYTDREHESQLADIGHCSQPYNPNDPTGWQESTCAVVKNSKIVDNYLNVLHQELVSENFLEDYNSHRTTEYEYIIDEPNWYLSLKTYEKTYDDGDDTQSSKQSWVYHNESAPGFKLFLLPREAITNPSGTTYPNYTCSADCIAHEYDYDEFGNVILDTVRGGYGNGFDSRIVSTEYTLRHGKPIKKTVIPQDSSDSELVLWQREVDANTGLARWHVDGSGSGFAYLYNSIGKITDSAPITRDKNCSLQVQYYDDENSILGRTIDYILPTDDNLLLYHTVSDMNYEIASQGENTFLSRMWNEPDPYAEYYFDGLGRKTQTKERYPGDISSSGYRSMFELTLYHDPDANDPCDLVQATDIPNKSRVHLTTTWIDGEDWPDQGCLDLTWKEVQYDGLDRAVLVRFPDHTEVKTKFWGDQEVKVWRTVATDITDPETSFATTTKYDALGRLRRLIEQVKTDPEELYIANYLYDHKDRLRRAEFYGTGPQQNRIFDYSNGGFLISTQEPEKNVTFTSYDGLGNLLAEATAGIENTYLYDGFGRLKKKQVDSVVASEFTFGDADPNILADPGDPSYNKITRSQQHNRFNDRSPAAVKVTHTWKFDGPGHRLDNRITSVSGIGTDNQGFELKYGYDQWGNLTSLHYPTWTANCRTELTRHDIYVGSWLTTVDYTLSDSPSTTGLASLIYHPNGRIEQLNYGDFYDYAFQQEIPDPTGMPRPQKLEVWQTYYPGYHLIWSEGDYQYDGSSNIARIGAKKYTYDGANRLAGYYEGTQLIERYLYDRFGNMLELERTDTFMGDYRYLDYNTGVTGDNRPDGVLYDNTLHPLNWDDRGNLTSIPGFTDQLPKTFRFSNEDRLLDSLDETTQTLWSYAYDTAGERIVAWWRNESDELTQVKFTLRDDSGIVLSDWILVPNITFGPTKDYLYARDRLVAQFSWGGDTLNKQYIFADHLRSTRVVIDAQTDDCQFLQYYPYGELRTDSTPVTSHLFTGHERDLEPSSSQLDYMHARYYSSMIHRFTSVDPVEGETDNSQKWNRYSYALNNPMSLIDPSGMTEAEVIEVKSDSLALELFKRAKEELAKITIELTDKEGLKQECFIYDVETVSYNEDVLAVSNQLVRYDEKPVMLPLGAQVIQVATDCYYDIKQSKETIKTSVSLEGDLRCYIQEESTVFYSNTYTLKVEGSWIDKRKSSSVGQTRKRFPDLGGPGSYCITHWD